jgi:predicted metal-dependent HD superfamily phosphohydrolase
MDMAVAESGSSASSDLFAGSSLYDGIELAIWFHDVIYVPGAADNEQRSADLFAHRAADKLSPEMIDRIGGYILSTTHHEPPTDEGSKFVVDIDLSGFGLPPELFRRDGDNIRREFDHISEAEFICGQTKFLQKLLDRGRIYSTSFFHDRYEAQARRNIRGTIEHYAKWDC